ncbi:putative immunity protein [Streptomyces sp. NPDC053560]|uniref:putative immunity protein n=1 Tax=Streptomyces sp. NPDC053560 TaxID=3365711 RepID=UPI0037D2466B
MPTVTLSKVRAPGFVTIRRGGPLTDADHHLLALWVASCAEHVLGLFESAQPDDPRPRQAIRSRAAPLAWPPPRTSLHHLYLTAHPRAGVLAT